VLQLLLTKASCTNLVQKNQISWAKLAHYGFFTINFTVWSHILSTPDVISATSRKYITHSKATQCGFPCTCSEPLEQTNTKTCCVSVAAQRSFPPVENYASWNMSLKTRALKPTTHQNMWSFGKQSDAHFDAWLARAPQTYPIETCNISGVMFEPHLPIFHFPHAILIHAPWPIHDVLDVFPTSHSHHFIFFAKFWHFCQRSLARDLVRVLITKRAPSDITQVLSFRPR
jgi:hypothetical protein